MIKVKAFLKSQSSSSGSGGSDVESSMATSNNNKNGFVVVDKQNGNSVGTTNNEEMIESTDELFLQLRSEAIQVVKNEPMLTGLLSKVGLLDNTTLASIPTTTTQSSACNISPAKTFEEVISRIVAHRLSSCSGGAEGNICPQLLLHGIHESFKSTELELGHTMSDAVRADAVAVVRRDPACETLLEVVLFMKGFASLVIHRAARRAWKPNNSGRAGTSTRFSALLLQSLASSAFGVDIHPAAEIGAGVMFDHASGIVIGETAVIGDGTTILHGVTLGGTGKENGDRHPKVGKDVLIGAGTKILGNIRIGDRVKIGAGSVVLRSIPSGATAVGAPARILLSAASAFAEAERSVADTGTFELVEQPSLDQCFPSSIPWVSHKGNDYIFSRMRFNSICVDNRERQYEWGAIEGVYYGTEDVCASDCVKGYGRAEARGCSTSQRPDPKKLVGFNYDCDNATCYCLYERDTLSSRYSKCFDSMNTNDYGRGNVYSTTTSPGATCYSLHIQPSDPPAPKPRKPTRRPTRKPARQPEICTRELDYKCYKSGRPSCCDKNNGRDCPKEMTICDNHPEGKSGWNYCSFSPDYKCWKSGWPSCCNGNSLNCPRKQPGCDIKKKPTPRPTRKPSRQPRGSSICTREPDFKCYKSGRPSCCDKNNGRDCPKEMTKCDNHPENWTGGSYCSFGPDYDCWKGGRPSCCNGNSKNCPRKQPRCDNKKTSTEELASQRFLRTNN